MAKVVSQRSGSRKFEVISKWNTIAYTVISRHHRFAEFADNYSSKDASLNLTYFKVGTITYPLNRFNTISPIIQLDDFSKLSRYDNETKLFLAFNDNMSKVKIYKEIISESLI